MSPFVSGLALAGGLPRRYFEGVALDPGDCMEVFAPPARQDRQRPWGAG